MKHYHYNMIVSYSKDLTIIGLTPIDGRYLLCKRVGDLLYAKSWCQRRPVVLAYGEILIDFHQVSQMVEALLGA